MNRYKPVAIAVAIALVALAVWKAPQIKAGLLGSPTPSPTQGPKAKPSPTPEPRPDEPRPDEQATPEPAPTPPAKCLDGSALTVTRRDGNQTGYRCESGATGAYTN